MINGDPAARRAPAATSQPAPPHADQPAPQDETPSTWRSRLSALGPGLLMASAAIGGSHLVSSTQAGALYGWQLVGLLLLVNLMKYPFFRFGPQYTV